MICGFFYYPKVQLPSDAKECILTICTQYRLNTACELFQFQNMDALKSKLPIFEH